MSSNPVNEFLPSTATPDRMDLDDEFDMARWQALKKDKLEEQKRLDEEHHQSQMRIEMQLEAENQHLLSQVQHKVQESIQKVFVDLQQSIVATVGAQVDLRLQQKLLREEHAASTVGIEQRHLNKITHLMAPSSARATKPHDYSVRESLTPKPFNIPMVNGRNQGNPSTQSEPPHMPIPQPTPVPRQKTAEPLPQEHVPQEPVSRQPVLKKPMTQHHPPAEPVISKPVSVPEPLAPEHMPAQRKVESSRLPDDRPQGETETSHNTVPGAKHGQAKRGAKGSKEPSEPKTPKDLRGVKDAKDATATKDPKASQTPVPTPRQDTKRKAAESPATGTSATTKRPRTRDRKPLEQEAYESAEQETPVNQTPGARDPSQTPTVQRTIPFNEIYQDGNAQYKHQIFEYKPGSGNWYIVKCDEHDVHFKYGNPVHGAAKHVASPQHGSRNKKHDLAIHLLGYLVTDCNAELAHMNNRDFKRALDSGYEVHNRNLLSKSGRQRADERKKQPNSNREGGEIHVNGDSAAKKHKKQGSKTLPPRRIIKPKECHFYQGFWSSTKKWYCLIVLPIRPDGSLREVGLREKFQEMPLIDNAPKCYRMDRVSLQIKGWQSAYEDGGPKVDKREYPVMYFDKNPPSLGWLHGGKFEELDLDNPPAGLADTKGLRKARQWYAEKMNHRKSWEEFKELGPGEPPLATPVGEGGWDEQGSLLRSAFKQDEDSPRRSRLRGADSAEIDDSSSSGDSDDEDPMKMDVGPIPDPEAGDSNYVDGSGSEAGGSALGTQEIEAQQSDDGEDGEDGEDEPNKEAGPTSTTSQAEVMHQDMSLDESVEGSRAEVNGAAMQDSSPRKTWMGTHHASFQYDQPDIPDNNNNKNDAQERDISMVLSEQERIRKNAQAKAAEAVKKAASRSRDPSEVPVAAEDASKAPAEQGAGAAQHQSQAVTEQQARTEEKARQEEKARAEAKARAENERRAAEQRRADEQRRAEDQARADFQAAAAENERQAAEQRRLELDAAERMRMAAIQRAREEDQARADLQAANQRRADMDSLERVDNHMREDHQARSGLWDHQRSRSDDVSATKTILAAPGIGKLNEGRKHSNLDSLMNPAANSLRTETNENRFDSYKRLDDLKRQMQSEHPARSLSVPIQPNMQPFQPPFQPSFQPPPVQQRRLQPMEPQAQPSAPMSHVLSPPPMQSPTMGPHSTASSTPVPGSGSGCSTPTVVMPGTSERWQAVRTPSFGATQQASRASFINTAPPPPPPGPTPGRVHVNGNGTSHSMVQQPAAMSPVASTPTSTTKSETPTSATDKTKKEFFDVCLFRDMRRGVRWSRDSPDVPYLRLVADPMQGVAVSTGAEGFTAAIEPGRVLRIDMDMDRERQRVQLVLKDGGEQVVVFEANSASGRQLNAKIQGRRFVTWVKKCNDRVDTR